MGILTAFAVTQLASVALYPAGVPMNIAGFPLPFLSTVEGVTGGTNIRFSALALAIDLLVWAAVVYIATFGLNRVRDGG